MFFVTVDTVQRIQYLVAPPRKINTFPRRIPFNTPYFLSRGPPEPDGVKREERVNIKSPHRHLTQHLHYSTLSVPNRSGPRQGQRGWSLSYRKSEISSYSGRRVLYFGSHPTKGPREPTPRSPRARLVWGRRDLSKELGTPHRKLRIKRQ